MTYDITKSQKNVTKGSIFDVASTSGIKPEEVLTDADVVVMLDLSSSMSHRQANGVTRFDKAKDALADIQKAFPGRCVLITFADRARMELGGVPSRPSGMTNVYAALEVAKQFDGLDTKFYLISDGEPNCTSKEEIFAAAEEFTDPINCIFIGEDHDRAGQQFMSQLAALTGGKNTGRVEPALLGQTIKLLITGE